MLLGFRLFQKINAIELVLLVDLGPRIIGLGFEYWRAVVVDFWVPSCCCCRFRTGTIIGVG